MLPPSRHPLLLLLLLQLIILLFIDRVDSLSSSNNKVVIYGVSQCRELVLLTSKIASKQGLDTSFICAPNTEDGSRYLMYGIKTNNENENEKEEYDTENIQNTAKPISSGAEIQDALQNATSLVLIGYDDPIETKTVTTLLDATTNDKLQKVILLSQMGVTQQQSGGFFGGGGGTSKLIQNSENLIRDTCQKQSSNLIFAIIRAGYVLKGGGPGTDDYGLNKAYYNTLLDIIEASVTMSHDKFTLGAICTPGDTIKEPNVIEKLKTKSSFDPFPYDTNRINIANAIVATILLHNGQNNNNAKKPSVLEFSISSKEGTVPPSQQEWEDMLNNL